jgi:hypothetical protein
MTFAVQDVRDKLDGVFLPNGSERPLILRYDPNLDPILRIGLTSSKERAHDSREQQLDHLRWLAEKRIKRELESIPASPRSRCAADSRKRSACASIRSRWPRRVSIRRSSRRVWRPRTSTRRAV